MLTPWVPSATPFRVLMHHHTHRSEPTLAIAVNEAGSDDSAVVTDALVCAESPVVAAEAPFEVAITAVSKEAPVAAIVDDHAG
jgi:hypothetical protein